MSVTANHSPNDAAGKRLAIEDIPEPDADWAAIDQFARTFNGYEVHGSFEACAEIGNARKSATLTDLRTCLFFEQRRWRHFGYDPDLPTMDYIRGVLEKIRVKVSAGDAD